MLRNCVVYLEKGHIAPGFTRIGQLRTVHPERFEKLDVSFRLLDLDAILRHSGETGAVPSFTAAALEHGKAVLMCILGCRITDPQVAPAIVAEIESKRSVRMPIDLDFAIDVRASRGASDLRPGPSNDCRRRP